MTARVTTLRPEAPKETTTSQGAAAAAIPIRHPRPGSVGQEAEEAREAPVVWAERQLIRMTQMQIGCPTKRTTALMTATRTNKTMTQMVLVTRVIPALTTLGKAEAEGEDGDEVVAFTLTSATSRVKATANSSIKVRATKARATPANRRSSSRSKHVLHRQCLDPTARRSPLDRLQPRLSR